MKGKILLKVVDIVLFLSATYWKDKNSFGDLIWLIFVFTLSKFADFSPYSEELKKFFQEIFKKVQLFAVLFGYLLERVFQNWLWKVPFRRLPIEGLLISFKKLLN